MKTSFRHQKIFLIWGTLYENIGTQKLVKGWQPIVPKVSKCWQKRRPNVASMSAQRQQCWPARQIDVGPTSSRPFFNGWRNVGLLSGPKTPSRGTSCSPALCHPAAQVNWSPWGGWPLEGRWCYVCRAATGGVVCSWLSCSRRLAEILGSFSQPL